MMARSALTFAASAPFRPLHPRPPPRPRHRHFLALAVGQTSGHARRGLVQAARGTQVTTARRASSTAACASRRRRRQTRHRHHQRPLHLRRRPFALNHVRHRHHQHRRLHHQHRRAHRPRFRSRPVATMTRVLQAFLASPSTRAWTSRRCTSSRLSKPPSHPPPSTFVPPHATSDRRFAVASASVTCRSPVRLLLRQHLPRVHRARPTTIDCVSSWARRTLTAASSASPTTTRIGCLSMCVALCVSLCRASVATLASAHGKISRPLCRRHHRAHRRGRRHPRYLKAFHAPHHRHPGRLDHPLHRWNAWTKRKFSSRCWVRKSHAAWPRALGSAIASAAWRRMRAAVHVSAATPYFRPASRRFPRSHRLQPFVRTMSTSLRTTHRSTLATTSSRTTCAAPYATSSRLLAARRANALCHG
mmetsp:Transcript_15393/g.42955  ORF Transcript_15393/g.42955 Transcript_15393/m.42955 type:complete len:418 (+) Transcript_15393:511-1764(+)